MSPVTLLQLPSFALSPHSILLAIIVLFISLLLLFFPSNKGFYSKKSHRLPPPPFKLPLIGNLHNLGSLPHRSLHALSQKYGPIMLLQLGQVPTLVVSSAEMAQEIMKTQDLVFATRPHMKAAKQIFYGATDVAFAPYGEYWRHVKKVSVVHLLSNRMVQSYQHIREEEVASMVGKISRSSTSLGVVNLSEILNLFANDLICRVASGRCSGDKGKKNIFPELVEETSRLVGEFSMGDYFPSLSWLDAVTGLDARIQKVSKKWDEIHDEVIEEHVCRSRDDRKKNNDFVDILLSLEKDPNFEYPLTRENIKAIIQIMFGAGTDTSYIVLEWGMAELLRNPQIMKKLQDEVRGIGSGKAKIREEDLSEMNYLKSVIKETLRLHPPAPLLLPRESMENTQIQGYEVPKQTRVYVNAWAIGRDPKYWEAPSEFRPERFMNSAIDFKGHDFQFIPFGAGRRICPGLHFAASTVELALANLVHKFHWELPIGMTAEDLDMVEAPGITIRKKQNLHLVATPYSN